MTSPYEYERVKAQRDRLRKGREESARIIRELMVVAVGVPTREAARAVIRARDFLDGVKFQRGKERDGI